MDSRAIREGVEAVLKEALFPAQETLEDRQTLMGDLGAESIDMLDIEQRLERRVGISLRDNRMRPLDALDDPKNLADGRLTATGAGELQRRYPFVSWELYTGKTVHEIADAVVTVGYVCALVAHELEAQQKQEATAPA